MIRSVRFLAPLLLPALLCGCMTSTTSPSGTAPAARVAAPPAPSLLPQSSEESRRLQTYYDRVQTGLMAQGLMRSDMGSRDAPYSAEELTKNFKRIALYEEYANMGGRIVARQTPSRLHRWDKSVLVKLEFGGAISEGQKAKDARAVQTYVQRLSNVTKHPILMTYGPANFHVMIVDEPTRRTLAPRLKRLIPTIGPAAIDTVVNLPRTSYCLVIGYDPEDDGTYNSAVAIIRAEHPDLLRLSCIHEEIAQGLGLANDSPAARPSVFNDDEEFALLTRHDEDLLRILYDRRLRPGMDAEEALPIVRQIASELAPGPS